jgi:hypothetical protein
MKYLLPCLIFLLASCVDRNAAGNMVTTYRDKKVCISGWIYSRFSEGYILELDADGNSSRCSMQTEP